MNNPYNAPAADLSVPGDSAQTYQPKVFAMKGRIGRVRYIAYSMGVFMALFLVLAVIAAVVGAISGGNQWVMIVLGLLFYIPLIAVSFIMAIRRVHDMGHSGWMSLIILVPLAQFWLLFAPGVPTTNEYGPRPVKNSTGVIIAAFTPFVFFALMGVLAAIAIPAYQAYMDKAKAAQEQTVESVQTEAVPE